MFSALGLLAAPLAAGAQQPAKVSRVGYLGSTPLTDPEVSRLQEAFRQGLRERGYVDGQNIAIEYRFAEGKYDRFPGLAAELVRLKVDVLVAAVGPAAHVAREATRTIPVVMVVGVDPVEEGLVATLARPGGNITGLSMVSVELTAKQVELLKEAVPKVSRVAVLHNPANAAHPRRLREAEVAARSLGVRLQLLGARDPNEVERAFSAMARERAGALLVLGDPLLFCSEHGSQTLR